MPYKKQIAFLAVLVLLSGAFNGWMDHLQFHETDYNPVNTWRNKYAKDSEGNLIPVTDSPWYYIGLYKPSYKESFPFSTTFLVSFTDPWHRYKALCFALFRTALVISFALFWKRTISKRKYILALVIVWCGLWLVQAVGFHLMYTVIK